MHDDDEQWKRLIFEGARDHPEQFTRDLEIHSLNLKLHLSEEEHWLAKAKKAMTWNVLFTVLAGIFALAILLDLLAPPQYGWWWVGSISCSLISLTFAYIHSRYIKKSTAASEKFRSLQPPVSLRPLAAAIHDQIEAEERAAAAARKRWWRHRR
ncbi:hypothetical protein [Rhodococcus koreensis]